MQEEELENDDHNNSVTLGRRSLLKLFSVAATASGGYVGLSVLDSSTEPAAAYGYGGQPLVESTANEVEPNDARGNANEVQQSTRISGGLDGAEVDWYACEFTTGDTVVAYFDRDSTDGVCALVIYGPEGRAIARRYVGTGDPVSVTTPTDTSGMHTIQVVNVNQGGGSYTLTIGTESSQTTTTSTSTTTSTTSSTSTTTSSTTSTTTSSTTSTSTTTSTTTSTSEDSRQEPYTGSPRPIPGRIQAENYDTGGEGVAYHDVTDGNTGGVYRSDDVDIQNAQDESGNYNVGWVRDGEWLEYTVDVTAGTYDLAVRAATQSGPTDIQFSIDGTSLGTLTVPDTGAWQSYQTLTLSGISLDGGANRILRVDALGDSVNLNWFDFARTDSTSTETSTETTVESQYGIQGYGEFGYGGSSDS